MPPSLPSSSCFCPRSKPASLPNKPARATYPQALHPPVAHLPSLPPVDDDDKTCEPIDTEETEARFLDVDARTKPVPNQGPSQQNHSSPPSHHPRHLTCTSSHRPRARCRIHPNRPVERPLASYDMASHLDDDDVINTALGDRVLLRSARR